MSEIASGLLTLSLLFIPVEAVAHLIWTGIRGFRPGLWFDATWAMALSWPALLLPFVEASGAIWELWVLSLALLGCWVMAWRALLNKRIPARFAWMPMLVMAAHVLYYSRAFGFVATTYMGVALVAWVSVCISSAFSIRAAARDQAVDRAVLADVPGFVWPT